MSGLSSLSGKLNVNQRNNINELTSGDLKTINNENNIDLDGELKISNNYSLTERTNAIKNIENVDIAVNQEVVIIKGTNITVNLNNCIFNFTESDYVNGTIEQDMFLVDIGM